MAPLTHLFFASYFTLPFGLSILALNNYWKDSQPKETLFPGQKPDSTIHPASIALTFKKDKAKAGIQKPATVHTLRHSFASHLLDQDEKLATIQKLLGHNSIKSTSIYLHVSPSTFDKVLSPLDTAEFQ